MERKEILNTLKEIIADKEQQLHSLTANDDISKYEALKEIINNTQRTLEEKEFYGRCKKCGKYSSMIKGGIRDGKFIICPRCYIDENVPAPG